MKLSPPWKMVWTHGFKGEARRQGLAMGQKEKGLRQDWLRMGENFPREGNKIEVSRGAIGGGQVNGPLSKEVSNLQGH